MPLYEKNASGRSDSCFDWIVVFIRTFDMCSNKSIKKQAVFRNTFRLIKLDYFVQLPDPEAAITALYVFAVLTKSCKSSIDVDKAISSKKGYVFLHFWSHSFDDFNKPKYFDKRYQLSLRLLCCY